MSDDLVAGLDLSLTPAEPTKPVASVTNTNITIAISFDYHGWGALNRVAQALTTHSSTPTKEDFT